MPTQGDAGTGTPALYENLKDHLPGMFYRCLYDEQWTIISVTPNCLDVTGYSQEELLFNSAISYQSIIHPGDNKKLLALFKEKLQQQMPIDAEYTIVTKAGVLQRVHAIANGVFGEGGALQYIEGYIEKLVDRHDHHVFDNAFSSYHKAISSGSLVSISDTQGNIIFANDLVCKYSGYSKKELLGQNHRILNSGYHPKAFFTDMWKTIVSGKIWRGEIRNKAKNGDFYWVDVVISPVLDTDGNILQYLSIRNIITDRKNVEIALLNSERQLKEISSSIPGAVYQFKIDKYGVWSFPYMSDGSIAVLGITPQQVYDDVNAAFERVVSEDLPELIQTIHDSADKFQPWLHRFRIREPNGTLHWIRGNSIPKRLDEGGILWHGTLIDITESKENEELLKAANSQIEKIFDTLDNAFWGFDTLTNTTIYASSGHEKTYGYKPEAFHNNIHLWREVILEEDRPLIDQLHQKLWNEKLVVNEYRIRHSDGTVKWIESRMTGTKDELGQLTRIDGIDTDISARKSAEQEKNMLLEELRQKYNALMQFNYIVSHNLRSPIANIIGLSSILEMPDVEETERQSLISNIKVSTTRLDEIVKDLGLVLSARSAIHATKTMVSLEELISNIEVTLEHQLKESGTLIVKDIDAGAGSIFTIRSYLESIMFNLIGNAIKYRSPGRSSEIKVSSYMQEGKFMIRVKDNGIGIDLKKHGSDIFGLYKRFNFEVEGKGLGLHMVKSQVETLGGKIEVESVPDSGTVFTVSLPGES